MWEWMVRTGRLPIRVRKSVVRTWQSSKPRRPLEGSAVGMTVPRGENRRSARGGMRLARGGIRRAIGHVSAAGARLSVARGQVNGSSAGVADAGRSDHRRALGDERSASSGRVRCGGDSTVRPGRRRDRSIRSPLRAWESSAPGQPVAVGWHPTRSAAPCTSTARRGQSSSWTGAVGVSRGGIDVEYRWSHRNGRWIHRNEQWIRRRENRVRAPSASERRALERNRSLRIVGSARVGDRSSGML